jgi:hypothetical protein
MKLHATSLSAHGYGKGWQINALVNGVESEMTFYKMTKSYALLRARAIIQQEGRLPHNPYKGENSIFKGFKVGA